MKAEGDRLLPYLIAGTKENLAVRLEILPLWQNEWVVPTYDDAGLRPCNARMTLRFFLNSYD